MVTLANNVIGFATGPLIVGLLSDRVGLQMAMALVTLFALPAAACLFLASRHYSNDKSAIDARWPPMAGDATRQSPPKVPISQQAMA